MRREESSLSQRQEALFQLLSRFSKKRTYQKRHIIELAFAMPKKTLSSHIQEIGFERVYQEAHMQLSMRTMSTDIETALARTRIGSFVPNRYGIPIKKIDDDHYEIYAETYSCIRVMHTVENLGYLQSLGLGFLIPKIHDVCTLFARKTHSRGFGVEFAFSKAERHTLLADFARILRIAKVQNDALPLEKLEEQFFRFQDKHSNAAILDRARSI